MNKYLIWFLDSLIILVIGGVGLLFSLNILLMGLLFFPEVVTKVDGLLGSNPLWFQVNLFPGTLPLFYLLTVIALCVLIFIWTMQLMKKVDIEKIIKVVREGLKGDYKKKEVKNE